MKVVRSADRTRKPIARPSRTISSGNLDPSGTAAPDLAIEIAQILDLRAADASENVAAPDSRFGGRSLFGDARDNDFVAIFGRKKRQARAAQAY